MKKESNVLTDTTRFVNISTKPHEIYIDGKKARTIQPGEEQVMPLFVAQVGADHLAKAIMYKKGIKAVTTPSAVKDKILADILPDVVEQEKIKIVSEEEYRKKVDEMLNKQEEAISSLSGGSKDDKDRIAKLEKELKALKVAKKK